MKRISQSLRQRLEAWKKGPIRQKGVEFKDDQTRMTSGRSLVLDAKSRQGWS